MGAAPDVGTVVGVELGAVSAVAGVLAAAGFAPRVVDPHAGAAASAIVVASAEAIRPGRILIR